jgi:two-component sensor histidine kinase
VIARTPPDRKRKSMKQTSIIGPYVRNGVLIGLVFPIMAVVICVSFLTPEGYPFSFAKLHEDFPLLWIIDTAPIVLGLISYAVGSNANKSHTRFLSQIQDINNELVGKNTQLESLIGEKEVLLKEIHHRVKNNLQVITSLLSLQSSFIEDDEAKALFRYSQYRINSMAMVHEMLYKSQDISKIDYSEYAKKLIMGLVVSMKGSDNKVELISNVPETNLNIDTAIPLGLLINEIITNALKYGIRDKEAGSIHIEITKIRDREFRMLIGDNGAGFSKDVNFRNSNSLGLMLIHRLTLQLKGNIEKDNNRKGTNYIVIFKEIDQNS